MNPIRDQSCMSGRLFWIIAVTIVCVWNSSSAEISVIDTEPNDTIAIAIVRSDPPRTGGRAGAAGHRRAAANVAANAKDNAMLNPIAKRARCIYLCR